MTADTSTQKTMRTQKSNRRRRLTGGLVAGVLLALGVFVSELIVPSAAESPAASGEKLEAYTETLPDSLVKIKMMPIPGGTIKIGGETVEVKPFWMAQTETPWEAYDVFLKSGEPSPAYDQTDYPADAIARPSHSYILPDLGWGHNGYPVINVSFISVQMFCRWLAAETGKKYRLPTEAEWEWAYRAGDTGPWSIDRETLEKTTWYAVNSGRFTHPVGTKEPNKWGLHDMMGNVGEWATDLEGKPVLCGGTFLDGTPGMIPGMRRRWRPEWQETDPQFPKSRWWLSDGKFVGFRIVCEP
jgi:formylglycine-generating enzyme required for sulfatase activity